MQNLQHYNKIRTGLEFHSEVVKGAGIAAYIAKFVTVTNIILCYNDLEKQPQIMSKGGSVIIGPNGRVISGPLIDEAGILYAELDLADLPRNRFDFDVVGHYARPDVFRLLVNKKESIREEKENLFQN